MQKLIITCGFILVLGLISSPAFPQDSDTDGITDDIDNCLEIPNGPDKGWCAAGDNAGVGCTSNEECGANGMCSLNQEDADGDSYGDACDYCEGAGAYDIDADGLCDDDDNCPYVPNADQKDSDGDGSGDVCVNKVPKYASTYAFKGSWFEIGRQIAHTFADTIMSTGNLYNFILGIAGPGQGWTPEKYYQETEDLIPQSIKDHFQGMAMGLTEVRPITYETAWEMVMTNNFTFALMNMMDMETIPDAPAPEVLGCTGLVVASDAGTFLAHNTDAQGDKNSNTSVIMYWEPDNGDNAYLTIGGPGWADANYILNDKGIGIALNAGNPNTNANVGLRPSFMIRYATEKASTLDEVINYFEDVLDQGNYFGAGAVIFVVDFNDSSMAKIEVRSEKMKVTYGQELKPGVTYVAATNHFVGDFNEDPDYYYESSWERLERVLELLPQFETYDLDTCWTILTDHGDGESNNNSISREGGFSGTLFGTVFTADLEIYYALGRPHEYFAAYGEPQVVKMSDYSSDATDDNVPCPVAMVLGSDQKSLNLLRQFRDERLKRTRMGRAFVKLYYDCAPIVTAVLENNADLKAACKKTLTQLLSLIKKPQ
jgi:hypothetical protein